MLLLQVESQSLPKDASGVSPVPGSKLPAAVRRVLFSCFSRIFLQAFTMTFMAEWGDRSQIATVILAAREVYSFTLNDTNEFLMNFTRNNLINVCFLNLQDVLGICIGGILGHSLCTGLAVLGGRMIAQKISVRTGMTSAFRNVCKNSK